MNNMNVVSLPASVNFKPDLPEGLEPVAYLHENRNRSDVITKEVKKLLHDAAQSCDYLHRPIDKSEHYTEPLVLQSAALAALAEKAERLAQAQFLLDRIPSLLSTISEKYARSGQGIPASVAQECENAVRKLLEESRP